METVILGWYVMVQTGSVLLLTIFGSLQYVGTLAAPMFGVLAAGLALAGLWLGFSAPEDYQQGDMVRVMFIHVPAAAPGSNAQP